MAVRAQVLCVGLMLCGACGPQVDPAPVRPLLPPPELTDTNPDPAIVEVTLIAAEGTHEYLEGKPAQVWGYRDGALAESAVTIPGPTLRAKEGDQILVHFRNELPVATTVHWHGIRLPNGMDGSTSSQRAVEPGESFDYAFTAKDQGSFWFHPHVKGDEQIEKGLYAQLVIEGGTAPEVAADRYFTLDDVKLQSDGALSAKTDAMDLMMGRQGNVLLVNGMKDAELVVSPGTRERWRFVNSANGRFFNLSLKGHRFLVIGWDGGLLPVPYEADTLLVAPGERYDVLVTFDPELPEGLALQNLHYDRGHDLPDPGPKDLFRILRAAPAEDAPAPLPSQWRTLERTATTAATAVRAFRLSEFEAPDGPQFFINDQFWPFNDMVHVTKGDVEIWEIDNQSEMDHPFHLHGMFFDVLDRDGVPEERVGWKDTVNVPRETKLRFAVRYDFPGMWMFHCHILEHAERGMMGDLMVE